MKAVQRAPGGLQVPSGPPFFPLPPQLVIHHLAVTLEFRGDIILSDNFKVNSVSRGRYCVWSRIARQLGAGLPFPHSLARSSRALPPAFALSILLIYPFSTPLSISRAAEASPWPTRSALPPPARPLLSSLSLSLNCYLSHYNGFMFHLTSFETVLDSFCPQGGEISPRLPRLPLALTSPVFPFFLSNSWTFHSIISFCLGVAGGWPPLHFEGKILPVLSPTIALLSRLSPFLWSHFRLHLPKMMIFYRFHHFLLRFCVLPLLGALCFLLLSESPSSFAIPLLPFPSFLHLPSIY